MRFIQISFLRALLPWNIIPRMIIAKVFLTRTYIRSIWSEFEDSTKASRLLCIDATICLGTVSCNRTRSIGTKSMNETTLGWIKPRISGIHCRLLRCQIFLSTTSSGKTLKYDLCGRATGLRNLDISCANKWPRLQVFLIYIFYCDGKRKRKIRRVQPMKYFCHLDICWHNNVRLLRLESWNYWDVVDGASEVLLNF